jgi:predicted AlkP superfamily phosphohydrolase/phosphomutase
MWTVPGSGDPALLWPELSKTMASHQKALNYFWVQDWDFFEFVITGTDRLHHFLWSAYQDKSHPAHQAFLDFYQQIDRIIAKIIAGFKKLNETEDSLFILSDHGFTGISQEVCLNAWLEKEGYLSFTTPSPRSLNDISLNRWPLPSTPTVSISILKINFRPAG